MFVILAIALIGLICIGLVGLTGVIIITRQNQAGEQVVVAVPPTLPPPTFTPTPTVTSTPTNTPEPTPTSTLVVNPEGQPAANGETPFGATPDPNVTPKNTLVVQPPLTPVPPPTSSTLPVVPPQMPDGGGVLPVGDQSLLVWAGLGLLMLMTMGAVKYLKRP